MLLQVAACGAGGQDTVLHGLHPGLYEEVGHDRAAVAKAIGDNPYSGFGFARLRNEKTAAELMRTSPRKFLVKNIEPYRR